MKNLSVHFSPWALILFISLSPYANAEKKNPSQRNYKFEQGFRAKAAQIQSQEDSDEIKKRKRNKNAGYKIVLNELFQGVFERLEDNGLTETESQELLAQFKSRVETTALFADQLYARNPLKDSEALSTETSSQSSYYGADYLPERVFALMDFYGKTLSEIETARKEENQVEVKSKSALAIRTLVEVYSVAAQTQGNLLTQRHLNHAIPSGIGLLAFSILPLMHEYVPGHTYTKWSIGIIASSLVVYGLSQILITLPEKYFLPGVKHFNQRKYAKDGIRLIASGLSFARNKSEASNHDWANYNRESTPYFHSLLSSAQTTELVIRSLEVASGEKISDLLRIYRCAKDL